MATIRMTLSAGAALIALLAIVPAVSQAQSPLQLVPGPNQARTMTSAGTSTAVAAKKAANKKAAKTPGNGTRTAATASNKKSARRIAAATQPSSNKSVRTNSKKTANVVASRRQSESTTNAQRARVASAPRAKHAVAVAQPVLSGAAPEPEPQILAQGGNEHVATDNVMRGGDSISLVGMLPWWRNDRMQDVNYGSEEAESKVMAAAEAWLAAHGGRAADDDTRDTDERDTVASVDETFDVADADEVNDIDLAAASVPAPPDPSFLQSLIALIGGAVAAAAASARLLFT